MIQMLYFASQFFRFFLFLVFSFFLQIFSCCYQISSFLLGFLHKILHGILLILTYFQIFPYLLQVVSSNDVLNAKGNFRIFCQFLLLLNFIFCFFVRLWCWEVQEIPLLSILYHYCRFNVIIDIIDRKICQWRMLRSFFKPACPTFLMPGSRATFLNSVKLLLLFHLSSLKLVLCFPNYEVKLHHMFSTSKI